jgi:hypothetical protein
MVRRGLQTYDIERFTETGFDENLREIRDVYSQFEQLGMATIPSSRINSYRAAFESLKLCAKENRRPVQSLAELVLHTTVEFAQLKTIAKAAAASPRRAAWDGQLRKLVSGMSIPTPESKHSPAHDFQFESYLAAVSELSGYDVRFAEPDVVVQGDGHDFGIAAKRPRSKRRIEKNCRKAANQITRSGLPGLVALDVSFVLYPNQCVNTNDLAGALVFAQAASNKFVAEHYQTMRDACRDDGVLGVLVCLQLPVLNFGRDEGPQLGSVVRWLVVPCCEPNDERLKWVLEYAGKCEIGLFGPR